MSTEPAMTDWTAIRRIRKRSGTRLCELATAAGISSSYLCLIERGHRQGAPATVLAIANALNVSIDEITTDGCGQIAA